MRRILAFIVVVTLTLSACGSDQVVAPTPSPAAVIVPTASPSVLPGSSPRPTASPKPSSSPRIVPGPSPTASGSPGETHCRGSDKTPGKPAARMIAEASANWAGYVIYRRATGVSCVEGSWVEPTVTCSASGRQAVSIWVGIDGVHSSGAGVDAGRTLVQVGTAAECRSGRVTHHAWREVLPADPASVEIPALAIRPGDRLWAMVDYRDGVFTMRIENRTSGGSSATTKALADAPRQTAEWIVEAPSINCSSTCQTLPLARFSKVTFSGAYAGVGTQRASIGDDKWIRGRIDLVRGGVRRTSVSGLRSSGTSFSVVWRRR